MTVGQMSLLPQLLFILVLLISPTHTDKTPCNVCKDLTKSFKEHFDKTAGQNFGGGNTAWEEKSLGTYALSETRLVEILEKTAKACDYKCSSLLEDQEEYIEEWFFKRQDKTDLFEDMCVDHLKTCCLPNRWGTDCQECPGGLENPCSGHGKCHGEGERSSSSKHHGTCTCDKGYTGAVCDECKKKFIKVGDTCEECSELCEGDCIAPGPSGCTACKKGYELLPDTGCTDIDECERDGCGDPLENCVNSEGSYECICKEGYERMQGKCQLKELYADEDEEDDFMTSANDTDDSDDSDANDDSDFEEYTTVEDAKDDGSSDKISDEL